MRSELGEHCALHWQASGLSQCFMGPLALKFAQRQSLARTLGR